MESNHHNLARHLPYYYDLVLVAFSADFGIFASAKNPLSDALCRADNGLCDVAFGAKITKKLVAKVKISYKFAFLRTKKGYLEENI